MTMMQDPNRGNDGGNKDKPQPKKQQQQLPLPANEVVVSDNASGGETTTITTSLGGSSSCSMNGGGGTAIVVGSASSSSSLQPHRAAPATRTTATTTTTIKTRPTTTTSTPSQQPQPQKRGLMIPSMIFFSGTSAVLAFAYFLYLILPLTALLSLFVGAVSLMALVYSLYQSIRQAYQNVMATRGIGDCLPAWLYRALTQESVHEFMTDPTFALEWRHLLLYFLPGISAEQLDFYIQRLAPHHQRQLQRQGMGHVFLPQPVMRLVMGEERLLQQQQEQQRQGPTIEEVIVEEQPPVAVGAEVATATTTTSPTTRHRQQRRLDVDDDDSASNNSDLGLEVTESDLIGGAALTDAQASALARSVGLFNRQTQQQQQQQHPNRTRRVTTAETTQNKQRNAESETEQEEEDLEEQYAQEEVVLTEAFWGSVYDFFWTPTLEYCLGYAAATTRPVVGVTFRYSLGLSVLSAGLGIWGYQRGIYSSMPTSTAAVSNMMTPRLTLPSVDTLWTTVMVGSATAVVSLFFWSYLKPHQMATNDTQGKKPPDDTTPKKKKEKDE